MATVKLVVGNYRYTVDIEKKGKRLFVTFPYNKALLEEIKMMEGAKWHGFEEPPIKAWSISDSLRNRFRLAFMQGENVYARFDTPLIEFKPTRQVYSHQVEIGSYSITRRYGIIAGEQGVGKSLAMIEVLEYFNNPNCIWVAPKSPLLSVQLELDHWNAKIRPRLMTYESLKNLSEEEYPQIIIYDEASRIKNPTAQRSQKAKEIADFIREKYGDKGAVLLLSGTPAPKDPADWWFLCEIAWPGFLREGNKEKFKRRLCIIEQLQSEAGGSFPKIVSWLDDEKKCAKCGKFENDFEHDETNISSHAWLPSKNEVALLYQRMKGIVLVKTKRECFSGDTIILTWDGPKCFSACNRIEKLYVQTDSGMEWLDCEIKNFGSKETLGIVFGDGTKCRTTLYHEWLYRERGILKGKKFTFELVENKTELPLASIDLPVPNVEGYCHGFVFGDGTYQNGNYSKVELFDNDNDLKEILLQFGNLGYAKRKRWQAYNNVIASLPRHWRELPTNPNKAYALGFILGLSAADGCVDEHIRIYQANFFNLDKIRDLAIFCGLRCNPIHLAREFSPFDGSRKPLYYFSFQTYNINPSWIIRRDHKSKLKIRKKCVATTIKELKYSEIKLEETYCAIVPKWHNFTLANGVITGNCLDLPEKRYETINCKPTSSIINAAKLITARVGSGAKCLTLLRELSDGFQYEDEEVGTKTCTLCKGKKTVLTWAAKISPEDEEKFLEEIGFNGYSAIPYTQYPNIYHQIEAACPNCNATGEEVTFKRAAIQIPCPKDQVLVDMLERHEEVGRLVVYAGFTGSVDRVADIVTKQSWDWIKVDGRGWSSSINKDKVELLKIFQNPSLEYPRVVFDGHPKAAGMGLTLHASPSTFYYSNDFDAEARAQSEDRIHRIGMDANRGCTIFDCVHLPTDQLVIDNLKRKKRLLDMTMGVITNCLETGVADRW